eukprot:gene4431-7806_t
MDEEEEFLFQMVKFNELESQKTTIVSFHCLFKDKNRNIKVNITKKDVTNILSWDVFICLLQQLSKETWKYEKNYRLKHGKTFKQLEEIFNVSDSKIYIYYKEFTFYFNTQVNNISMDNGAKHFLLVQCVVDLVGSSIIQLSIHRGHLNDKLAFLYSGLKKKVESSNIYLISDNGFSASHVLNLNTLPLKFKESYGAKFLPSVRSVIENIYGMYF